MNYDTIAGNAKMQQFGAGLACNSTIGQAPTQAPTVAERLLSQLQRLHTICDSTNESQSGLLGRLGVDEPRPCADSCQQPPSNGVLNIIDDSLEVLILKAANIADNQRILNRLA